MSDVRTRDTRLCFLGDSLTLGVGDAEGLGWVGRLAAARRRDGWDLTSYNLGVRMDTGPDLVHRLPEVQARLRNGERYGLVVSFGVNDTTSHGNRVDDSVGALDRLLGEANGNGWAALAVEPPPIADPAHDLRAAHLADLMLEVCAARSVQLIGSRGLLADDPAWQDAMADSDGFHPTAAGYARWASLLEPGFLAWLNADWPER